MIPKPGRKRRRLGIATVRDRVVQAAIKLVLEPIFEADFKPCSYGFRPGRRAQDAVAEIHFLCSRTDADSELKEPVTRRPSISAQSVRGWTNYFRHGVYKASFDYLRAIVWRRVVNWLRRKHQHRNWKWLRRRYLPGWWPTEGEHALFDTGAVEVTRYRYRANRIPSPWVVTTREAVS